MVNVLLVIVVVSLDLSKLHLKSTSRCDVYI